MNAGEKMENPHAGHRDRLRKRFLEEGGESFEKHQLLELLLFGVVPRKDTNEMAHKLLNNFNDSFNILINSYYIDIIEKSGVPINVAVFLNALAQFIKVYQLEILEQKTELITTKQCGEYAATILMNERIEKFYIFCLNAKKKLIRSTCLLKGTSSRVIVEPSIVVKEALFCNAVSVVFAHNHPGGTLRPSEADIELTLNLKEILTSINIELSDHIIVANGQYYSLRENKHL